ncbi:MAG: nitrite reductase/ring-hydroxylating ferredoxin subunit [Bradymonadia bacterium]|jgi:nitrite reductase/ring-hydroxylating ferredoxin subunit
MPEMPKTGERRPLTAEMAKTLGIDRRTAIRFLGGGCALAVASVSGCTIAEVFGAGGAGFDFDLSQGKFAPLTAVDGVVAIDEGRPILLIRTAQDTIVALNRICTHTQCDMAPDKFGVWRDGRLQCTCHDSFFDAEGKVLSGPAPRDLTRYAVDFDANAGTGKVQFGDAPEPESNVPESYRGLTNPFDGDADAITAGETVYGQCAGCHGSEGEGSEAFMPPATAFNGDNSVYADDYLFWRIRTGGMSGPEGSVMGAYPESSLPDDQVWQIISYLRSIAQ